MKTISCIGLLLSAVLATTGCRSEDDGGGDGDRGGEGGADANSGGYVCVMTVHSGYSCSDGDTYTAPTETFCRDDFDSLDECEGTMVGQTDQADGCIFETTFSGHQWAQGPCSKHYEDSGDETGGDPETCDSSGSCDTCAACAEERECAGEFATCQTNGECVDLAGCVSGCASGDQSCVDDCASYYDGGVDDLVAYYSCVLCSACYSDCDGASSCN